MSGKGPLFRLKVIIVKGSDGRFRAKRSDGSSLFMSDSLLDALHVRVRQKWPDAEIKVEWPSTRTRVT